jgi:hypothetical protein
MESQPTNLFREVVDSAQPKRPENLSLTPDERENLARKVEEMVRSALQGLIKLGAPRTAFEFDSEHFEGLKSEIRLNLKNNPIKKRQALSLVSQLAKDWGWVVRTSEMFKYLELSAQEFADQVKQQQ